MKMTIAFDFADGEVPAADLLQAVAAVLAARAPTAVVTTEAPPATETPEKRKPGRPAKAATGEAGPSPAPAPIPELPKAPVAAAAVSYSSLPDVLDGNTPTWTRESLQQLIAASMGGLGRKGIMTILSDVGGVVKSADVPTEKLGAVCEALLVPLAAANADLARKIVADASAV